MWALRTAQHFSWGKYRRPRGSYALVSSIFGGQLRSRTHRLHWRATHGNGAGIATSDPVGTQLQDYLLLDGLFSIPVVSATNANSGQVIYTGGINYISVLSAQSGVPLMGYATIRIGHATPSTSGMEHAVQGMAIDGNSNLWVSESANGGVLQIPESSATSNPVPATEFLHGTTGATGGGTVTATAPYGIGIDATGNVWMTNAGCTTTGCTPGNFTLTEIVGAGVPTITPVSAQITGGGDVGTKPTH